MSAIDEITRDSWLNKTFPEWGTWLTEEIAQAKVPEKTLSMWWLGNMGIWIKSDHGTNVVIDMWNQTGKQTIGSGHMKKRPSNDAHERCAQLTTQSS
ncbi:MBL fold metallo-hydrolase [Fannyhessea vaginae]|uniref:hypothetical protein n=1 Tax=Fannyhessea vaginae TaxID=82135 RepID=UPI000A3FB58B|nr:hypothetical protein [Fannyhessea vaginae]